MKTLSLLLLSLALLSVTIVGWESTDQSTNVPLSQPFSFQIGLKPQNLDTLEALFWEISDPKSPHYANYLSDADIAKLIALPQEEIDQVLSYLRSTSQKHCEVNIVLGIHKDNIFVTSCVGEVLELFPNLQFVTYHRGAEEILRSRAIIDMAHNAYLLGVPSRLHDSIDTIQGITDLPPQVVPSIQSPPLGLPINKKTMTVKDMVEMYKLDLDLLTSETLEADDGQVRIGAIEFTPTTSYSKKQLAAFQAHEGVPLNPVRKIIGSFTSPISNEVSLDIQTLTTIGQKMQVWQFSFTEAGNVPKMAETVLSTPGAPRVLSISFAQTDDYLTPSFGQSSDRALMKLGLRGFSVFVATGDFGPYQAKGPCGPFVGSYPASSPFVTAVGGMVIASANDERQTWMRSGGGFSSFSAMPDYQKDVVEKYLNESESLPANAGGKNYNTANRAYPDIAGVGGNYLVYSSFGPIVSQGTSGACPQYAAVVAVINAYRYQKGAAPLGFINPALYQSAHLIDGDQDITAGQTYSYPFPETQAQVCDKVLHGFKTAVGWDAATGLGTPTFETLLKILGDLPGVSTSN